MQSGIKASEELTSQFNTLLSTPTAFALIATISAESLTPVTLLSASGRGFDADLAQLEPYLQPREAIYALLRRHDAAPHLAAVTYVPDAAPVRQKMLFASTRLALARELGTEHFRDTVFATSAAELTPDGFRRLDAHAALEAPLTEEERTLGDVRRAEAEAGQGSGMREIHLSKSLAMPVEEAAMAALREMASAGRGGIVTMKINPDTEAVVLAAPSPPTAEPTTIADVLAAISPTEPRFTFFRYSHERDGAVSSPVLFVYTNPAAPAGPRAIKNRMLYPLMKRAVLEVAAQQGVTPDKKFEIEDPSELTEAAVLQELYPPAAARQGFSRPKRPGR